MLVNVYLVVSDYIARKVCNFAIDQLRLQLRHCEKKNSMKSQSW